MRESDRPSGCFSRIALLVTAMAAVASLAQAADSAALGTPASWIEHMTTAIWPGKTVAANATLVTHDALGSGLDTEMALVRSQDGADVRTQIRVTAPEMVKGTVYEVFSRGGKPLDRMVYFPALDRARDFSGIRRTDSFFGSEFTYEDLEIAAPVESEWQSVEALEEGGRRLVRITSAPYSFYSRVERIVDAKTYLPIRTLYYDLAGRLFKRADFDAVQSINGHSMPTRVSIEDVQNGEKSEFRLHDIHLNTPIDEKLFSESPIQKRRVKH